MCRASQTSRGHFHVFLQGLDKERKKFFEPASYYNNGLSEVVIKELERVERMWMVLCSFHRLLTEIHSKMFKSEFKTD